MEPTDVEQCLCSSRADCNLSQLSYMHQCSENVNMYSEPKLMHKLNHGAECTRKQC